MLQEGAAYRPYNRVIVRSTKSCVGMCQDGKRPAEELIVAVARIVYATVKLEIVMDTGNGKSRTGFGQAHCVDEEP